MAENINTSSGRSLIVPRATLLRNGTKPSAPESKRNGTIEFLRVVAACAVIWFHFENAPYRRAAYAGLVYFLIISVVFQKGPTERMDWLGYLKKRGTRLLIPWIAWFAFYGLTNIVIGKRLFPASSGILADALTGPWIGLWYLPFSFVSAVGVYALQRGLGPANHRFRFIFYFSISLISLIAVSMIRASFTLATPWSQWLQATPSIPIGLALTYASEERQRSVLHHLALLQLAIIITCAWVYPFDPGMALSYGIGSSFVSLGLFHQSTPFPPVAKLAPLCLGAYLIHGWVMSSFKLIPWVTRHLGAWFILTTVVSFIAAALLKRTTILKLFI